MFYKESMKVNHFGLIISVGIGIILSLFLGYLYAMVTYAMPIIYVNILLTFGFGIILGYIVRILVKLTNNRNRRSRLIVGLVIGLFAMYFQWSAFILVLFQDGFPTLHEFLANLHWITYPDNFIKAVADINHYGSWTAMGITFKGFVLTLIWIAEAVIIVGLPIISMLRLKPAPFSELLGRWYPKYTLYDDFESIAAVNKFVSELKDNALLAIKDLSGGEGIRYSKIHLFYHKDENVQYIAVDRIFVENQGRGKKRVEVVINNMAIDNESAQQIMDEFICKRIWIDSI